MTNAPSRFWVLRHPDSTGSVIAKFDTPGDTIIPPEIDDYADFTVHSVSDRANLESHTVDQSGLTSSELDRLDIVYPTD